MNIKKSQLIVIYFIKIISDDLVTVPEVISTWVATFVSGVTTIIVFVEGAFLPTNFK